MFKKLNACQIKYIMAFLMLLDHLRYIYNFIPPDLASIFTLVSRCVAPMFAYLAVEGIRHTRNLKKYCLRLFIFAGIMFAGNTALNALFKTFSASLLENEQVRLFINNNVIFTLAAGVFCIALIIWGKEKKGVAKYGYFVASAICFIAGVWGEWGSVIIPFMLVTYFFRDNKILRYLGYVFIEIIAILLYFSEPFWFIMFPFILLYNGERGSKSNFNKYFFYLFYPIHLWIIAIINFFILTYLN